MFIFHHNGFLTFFFFFNLSVCVCSHFLCPDLPGSPRSRHVPPMRGEGPRRRVRNDDGGVPAPGGVSAHQLHTEVLHPVAFPLPGVASHGGGSPADL